jgi:hypothetical protein
MKAKRVDCGNCENFEFPCYDNLIEKKEKTARCKLGKRVMFRVNGIHPDSSNWDVGYFRYCNDYKESENSIRETPRVEK